VVEVTILSAFAPHIACIAGAAVAIGLDAFDLRPQAVLAAVLGTAAACVLGAAAVGRPTVLTDEVVLSGAAFSGSVAVICGLGALMLAASWAFLMRQEHAGGVAALSAVLIASAATVAVAADILVLLISLEVMALCAYALVWSARTAAATEAAVKYFVQGAVATGLFVLGLAIVFGLHGNTTSYVWIRTLMISSPGPPVTTAFVLIGVALAYKLGAFPFHSWALDAFETASPHASALLAGLPKIAAIIAMMTLYTRAVFSNVAPEYLLWVFGAIAIASMAFGAFGGLSQSSYTRMLAYSGVAQVGYALVGLSVGDLAMAPVAVLVSAYAIAGSAAFMAAAAVHSVRPKWDGTIAGLAGLGRERRWLSAGLAVAMFSLVGMPLTAGFWGKFLVFGTAVALGYWWLAFIGVSASVVSFGYYGAVLRSIYFAEPAEAPGAPRDVTAERSPSRDLEDDEFAESVVSGRGAELAVVICAAVLLVVGILPLVAGLERLMRFFTFG